MRNLKRALSLALASVMLLGMMVVGAGATSFPDVDDSNNVEAIEVLEAVKVFVGDENGNLNPDENISRNQMAVILAKLLKGPDADNYAFGSFPFTDVPDWAQKYVACCYDNGIVAGRGDGIYDGDSTVNGQEAAAMVLRILGYTGLEGTGTNWAQPVVAKANSIGLFDNVAASATAPLIRDQVAQLALNALEATMVEPDNSASSITTPEGFTMTTGVKYEERLANSLDYKNAIGGTKTDAAGNATLQLGEYLYKGDLKLNDDTSDEFGAPATAWTYKGTKIGSYATAPDLTYTKAVKGKDLYSDLGKPDIDSVVNKVDGVAGTIGTSDVASGNDSNLAGTGRGVLTKVYYDTDDNEVTIISINTYLVKASSDYNTKDETLSVTPYGVLLTSSKIDNEDVNVSAFLKDDLILVTGAKNSSNRLEIMTAELAPIVENVTVSAWNDNDYVTAGEKYEYSQNANYDPDSIWSGGIKGGYNLQKTSYNLVLDNYGYVIGAAKHSEGDVVLDDILFVKEADHVGLSEYKAKVVFMDGTEQTITVATVAPAGGDFKDVGGVVTDSPATAVLGDGKIVEERFYEFSVKNNGDYELEDMANSRQGHITPGGGTTKDVDGDSTTPIRGTSVVATNNTIFITKNKVFTGLSDAPTVENSDVYYLLDTGTRSNYLMAVYTPEEGKSINSTSEYVYLLEYKGEGLDDADGDKYYNYTAIVDGEKVTYEVANKLSSLTKGLYEITSTKNGYPELPASPVSTFGSDVGYYNASVNSTDITYESGVVTDGTTGLKVNSDTKVYVVDVDDKSAEIRDAAGVEGIDTGTYTVHAIYVSKSDKTVDTLWLAKTSPAVSYSGTDNAALQALLDADISVVATGAVKGALSVPAGVTLTLQDTSAVGTITTETGSTVVLDSGASTPLPAITGTGSVQIKATYTDSDSDVTTKLGAANTLTDSNAASDTRTGGEGDGVIIFNTTNAGVKLTGSGKLSSFYADDLDTVRGRNNAASLGAFKITINGLTQTTSKIKGEVYTNGVWKAMTGDLGDGNYGAAGSSETINLLLSSATTQVKFTITTAS